MRFYHVFALFLAILAGAPAFFPLFFGDIVPEKGGGGWGNTVHLDTHIPVLGADDGINYYELWGMSTPEEPDLPEQDAVKEGGLWQVKAQQGGWLLQREGSELAYFFQGVLWLGEVMQAVFYREEAGSPWLFFQKGESLEDLQLLEITPQEIMLTDGGGQEYQLGLFDRKPELANDERRNSSKDQKRKSRRKRPQNKNTLFQKRNVR